MATAPTVQSLYEQLQGAQTALNQKTGLNTQLGPLATKTTTTFKPPTTTNMKAGDIGTSPLSIPKPPTPQKTTGPLSVANTAIAADATTAAAYTPPVNPQKEQAQGYLQKILGNIGTQAEDINNIYKEEQLAQKKERAQKLSTELDVMDKAFRDEVKSIKENPEGKFGGAIQADIAQAEDRYQNNRANAALVYKVAAEDYNGAAEIVSQKVQALKDQNQSYLQAYQLLIDSVNNDMTESEQLQAQAMYTQKATDAKMVSDTYSSVLQAAVNNRAPASVLSAIDTAARTPGATASSIYQAAGQYASTPDNQIVQLDNGQTVIVDKNTGAIIKNLGGQSNTNAPVSGEFAGVITGAMSLVAGTKKEITRATITGALASGDYASAYAAVANAVEDGLTGTNKTKFADARTDLGVMQGMRDAIQAYSDAGGKMGYLKGTADQIAKNFGQLKTDPRFASLAIQLEREFQSYRNNMTGAAFSPEESREYAKVNPRSNATLDLNLATIDGAQAQLANRITSTVNARLPEAQKIYDLAFPSASVGGGTNQPLSVDEAYAAYLEATAPTTGGVTSGYKPFNLGNIFGF